MSFHPFGIQNFRFGLKRSGGFSPAALFAANEPGLWLDPSDFSTMFQERTGVTPVTAVGQPVGLILDKSRAQVLGTSVAVPTTSTAQWSVLSGGTVASDGTSITLTNGAAAEGYAVSVGAPIVAGRTYIVTYTVVSSTSGSPGAFSVGGVRVSVPSGNGVKRLRVVAADTQAARVSTNTANINDNIVFRDFSIQEVSGNCAYQATSASRPILGRHPAGGIRNQAVGSAAVTNTSNWPDTLTSNGITFTKIGSGVDTDGLPYVDIRYQGTATGTFISNVYATVPSRTASVTGATFTASAYVKLLSGSAANNNLRAVVVEETSPTTFIGSTGSAAATSTEQRVSVSRTLATGNQARVEVSLTFGTGDVINATYRIKGLQLEAGATVTAYQHNVSAVDVTETGIPSVYYLAFDGVDDFLVTNTVTPGTDKAQVFAGVRKMNDATEQILLELSSNSGTVPGKIGLWSTVSAALPYYKFRSRGSLVANDTQHANGPSSPVTSVLAGLGDVTSDTNILRYNGEEVANQTSDQGSGNYEANPIYIGRRGGSSLPFNGRIYSLIVRFGANLTAGLISDAERAVNSKTGAY